MSLSEKLARIESLLERGEISIDEARWRVKITCWPPERVRDLENLIVNEEIRALQLESITRCVEISRERVRKEVRDREIIRRWTGENYCAKATRKRLDALKSLEVMGEALEVHDRPGDKGRMHVVLHFFERAHRDLLAAVEALVKLEVFDRTGNET